MHFQKRCHFMEILYVNSGTCLCVILAYTVRPVEQKRHTNSTRNCLIPPHSPTSDSCTTKIYIIKWILIKEYEISKCFLSLIHFSCNWNKYKLVFNRLYHSTQTSKMFFHIFIANSYFINTSSIPSSGRINS